MLHLDNEIWKTLKGGYKVPYDVSEPLKALFKSESDLEIDSLIDELWNQLHHQGDVGLASYYAIPHLVLLASGIRMRQHALNLLNLIVTIETARLNPNNPELPVGIEDDHDEAMHRLGILSFSLIKENWNLQIASTILSAIAVHKGEIAIAKGISLFDDESVLQELLEMYG